jgi:hypothetical protein
VGGHAAIGKRNASSRGSAESGGNAGNELEVDASGAQGLDFFGGTAEQERVATLETNDDLVFCGGSDQERVNVVLGEEPDTAALADVDAFGGGRDKGKDFGADERVVENDVGGLEQTGSLGGEEFGITGSGADEKDFSGGFEH